MNHASRTIHRAAPLLLAAFVLALSACTTTTGGGRSSDGRAAGTTADKVAKRALARWKHLIASEADKAYDYLSPGVRSTWTREKYAGEMTQRPVKWEKAELYGEPVCEADDACSVKLLVTYSMDVPLPNVGRVTSPSVLEEKWIALDGVWYHVPAEFSRK